MYYIRDNSLFIIINEFVITPALIKDFNEAYVAANDYPGLCIFLSLLEQSNSYPPQNCLPISALSYFKVTSNSGLFNESDTRPQQDYIIIIFECGFFF